MSGALGMWGRHFVKWKRDIALEKHLEQQRDYLKRTPREKAYQAIDTERAYQDTKYGTLDTRPLSLTRWEELIDEYLTKLTDEGGHAPNALKRVRQIAALCVACMEQHGAPPREPTALTEG